MKKNTRNPQFFRLCQGLLTIGICLFVMGRLPAQLRLVERPYYPTADSVGDCWLNTQTQRVLVHKGARWDTVSFKDIKHIWPCGKMIALALTPKSTFLMNPSGYICGRYYAIECYDAMSIGAVHQCNLYFVDTTYLGISENTLLPAPGLDIIVPDTVAGQLAYCVSKSPELAVSQGFGALHGWGMLGVNGKWIIPPDYDTPIRFINGVAEVGYYGERRKINEQGRMLELVPDPPKKSTKDRKQ